MNNQVKFTDAERKDYKCAGEVPGTLRTACNNTFAGFDFDAFEHTDDWYDHDAREERTARSLEEVWADGSLSLVGRQFPRSC